MGDRHGCLWMNLTAQITEAHYVADNLSFVARLSLLDKAVYVSQFVQRGVCLGRLEPLTLRNKITAAAKSPQVLSTGRNEANIP